MTIEQRTGQLFGELFPAYDTESYLQSVDLFRRRFEDNGFDVDFFRGKRCLDVGCGGGRYSIAMAKLGAESVVGVDVSKEGIEDARRRAASLGLTNVQFVEGSADHLPLEDNDFDAAIFSGVLMVLRDPRGGLNELARVLKPNGFLYLLVYATGGVRWPLIDVLRSFAEEIGLEAFDRALASSSTLDVRKRRTYFDDLLVPLIDYYTEDRLRRMLDDAGFEDVDRWQRGRLDHEEDLDAYVDDLEKLWSLYDSGSREDLGFSPSTIELFRQGASICRSVVDYARTIREFAVSGAWTEERARAALIGQGHHRMTARRRSS